MKTNVADTSIEAYHGLTVAQLSASQKRVIEAIEEGRNYSRAEIAAKTGMRLSSVCGRVNELIAARLLEPAERRSCAETGKSINPVRLPRKQLELI